jgi:hypothetical protein
MNCQSSFLLYTWEALSRLYIDERNTLRGTLTLIFHLSYQIKSDSIKILLTNLYFTLSTSQASYLNSTLNFLRGKVYQRNTRLVSRRDYGIAHLIISAGAHYSRLGNRKYISHILTSRI